MLKAVMLFLLSDTDGLLLSTPFAKEHNKEEGRRAVCDGGKSVERGALGINL